MEKTFEWLEKSKGKNPLEFRPYLNAQFSWNNVREDSFYEIERNGPNYNLLMLDLGNFVPRLS